MTGPQTVLTVICAAALATTVCVRPARSDTAAAANGLLDQIVAKIPQ